MDADGGVGKSIRGEGLEKTTAVDVSGSISPLGKECLLQKDGGRGFCVAQESLFLNKPGPSLDSKEMETLAGLSEREVLAGGGRSLGLLSNKEASPVLEGEKQVDQTLRCDSDIIKEFLGERNLLPDAAGRGSQSLTTSAPPRQPFSDSSWLDKFLDERDKELDNLLEEESEEEEETTLCKEHTVGRPSTIDEEEYVRRHKQTLETYFELDYNNWTNVAYKSKAESDTLQDEASTPKAEKSEESLEILTDDFESSSACSSQDSLEVSLAQQMDEFREQPNLETEMYNQEKATCAHAFFAEADRGGDRELYNEAVRAAELGASHGRQRMEAVISANVAANQGAAMRLGWTLTFANSQLEDAYRLAHIANGGDGDYLCAVLRIWFSVLHLYILGRQFSIVKSVQWGWISVSAPEKPLLTTSLEWNLANFCIMMGILVMQLRWRNWWNKNRLLLLSLYSATIWAMELWYIFCNRDDLLYRKIRAGVPSFVMGFMYNMPFLLHLRFRALALVAQLGALTLCKDYALLPWAFLFHVVSTGGAYFLDRRSRLLFVRTLPPWLLIPGTSGNGSIMASGAQARCSSYMWGILFPDETKHRPCEAALEQRDRPRRAWGPGYFADRDASTSQGKKDAGSRLLSSTSEEESAGSRLLEDQLRERLRQRRTSLGGFAGGFAGVGGVKSGTHSYGVRLSREMQLQQANER